MIWDNEYYGDDTSEVVYVKRNPNIYLSEEAAIRLYGMDLVIEYLISDMKEYIKKVCDPLSS